MNYLEKLNHFAKVVEEQKIQKMKDDKLDCPRNIESCKTKVISGNKYDKVDIGNSGHFMVEARTQTIYGIKAYGQVHKGHSYGTLDTIDEWNWKPFYPTKNN